MWEGMDPSAKMVERFLMGETSEETSKRLVERYSEEEWGRGKLFYHLPAIENHLWEGSQWGGDTLYCSS
jgi:hypothetical protein